MSKFDMMTQVDMRLWQAAFTEYMRVRLVVDGMYQPDVDSDLMCAYCCFDNVGGGLRQ